MEITKLSQKPLTFKQRKWLDIYYKTGNATEAAWQVYDCKNRKSAEAIGYENLGKLGFNDILEGVGLTDHYLSQKVKSLTEAKRAVVIKDKIAMVDDNATQAKATELGLKIKGRLRDNAVVQVNNFIPLLGGDSSKNAIPADNSD